MKRIAVTLLQVLVLWAAVVYVSHAADFSTLGDAAKAALVDAEALTADFEAGGTIYLCSGRYAYLPPHTDGKRDRVSVVIMGSAECVLAGMYHTHPKGDARFSAQDVREACKADTVSYIKPRGGNVRAFDCHGMSYAARTVLAARPVNGKEI